MKTTLLKLVIRATFAVVLLVVGFAAGFPVGQSIGFTTGSEWSFVQADLLAKEAGVFMPVNYKGGTFHVVVKQPRQLHKDARKVAEMHDEEMSYVNSGKSALAERVQLVQRISLVQ